MIKYTELNQIYYELVHIKQFKKKKRSERDIV